MFYKLLLILMLILFSVVANAWTPVFGTVPHPEGGMVIMDTDTTETTTWWKYLSGIPQGIMRIMTGTPANASPRTGTVAAPRGAVSYWDDSNEVFTYLGGTPNGVYVDFYGTVELNTTEVTGDLDVSGAFSCGSFSIGALGNVTAESLIVSTETTLNSSQDPAGDFQWDSIYQSPAVHFDADTGSLGLGGAANASYSCEISGGWIHLNDRVFIDGVITQDAGDVVFNEAGGNYDLRIEGAAGAENAFFVQGSDGYVGIGTNTPSASLEVNGTVACDSTLYVTGTSTLMDHVGIGAAPDTYELSILGVYPTLEIRSTDTNPATARAWMCIKDSAPAVTEGAWWLGFDGGQMFQLQHQYGVNKFNWLNITSTGDVGISTTTIPDRLCVYEGAINVDVYAKFGNSSSGISATDGLDVGCKAYNTSMVIWNHENTDLWFGTNGASREVITAAGYHGIGVAVPSSSLDVAGTIEATLGLTIDTNTFVVDGTTNRIGIGTAAPGASLEVVGNIKASGDVYNKQWADYGPAGEDGSTIVGWLSFLQATIYYKRLGNLVWVVFNINGVSDSTAATFTLPYTSVASTAFGGVLNITYDNSGYVTTPGRISLPTNSATVTIYKDQAGAAWTASNDKVIQGQFFYEAQ